MASSAPAPAMLAPQCLQPRAKNASGWGGKEGMGISARDTFWGLMDYFWDIFRPFLGVVDDFLRLFVSRFGNGIEG